MKLWTSTAEEGWLSTSDSESWRCNQTLELISSTEHRVEEAFFNQVVVMPQQGLILLANAKKNAIYAIHINYGPYPAATCMDYIADFTVTMPILSLTGTRDISPDGEHVVQVYCVQTQAIQQYALNLAQCLPPVDNLLLAKDPCISHVYDGINSEGFSRHPGNIPSAGVSPIHSVGANNSEHFVVYSPSLISSEANNIPELPSSNIDIHPSAPPLPTIGGDNLHSSASPGPIDLDLSGLSGSKGASKCLEHGPSYGERDVYLEVGDYQAEQGEHDGAGKFSNLPLINEKFGGDNLKTGQSDISMIQNSHLMFKLAGKTTHLVTPLEILSGMKSSSDTSPNLRSDEVKVLDLISNNDLRHAEVVKVVDESVMDKSEEFGSQKEANNSSIESKNQPSSSPASNIKNDMPKEGGARNTGLYNVNEVQLGDYVIAADSIEPFSGNIEENFLKNTTDHSQRETGFVDIPASKVAKGKRQKTKQAQASGSSSPSSTPFNSIDSSNEPRSSVVVPGAEVSFSQIMSMQELLNQVIFVFTSC